MFASTDAAPQALSTEKNPDQLLYNHNDGMRQAVLPVTVFVGIEVVLGFCGNLLILYVFLFRYHVCNFKYFVLCLALTDLTSSLTTMPGEMVTQLFWYIYPVPIICKIKSFFNIYTVCSEALCLLTIAVDRFRKVCKPLGWQIKPKHAMKLCFVIYAVAFVLAFPVAILWGTHQREMNISGVIVNATICEKDGNFKNTLYPLIYSSTVEAIVCISLFVMLILYIFVARSLFKKKSDSSPSTAAYGRKRLSIKASRSADRSSSGQMGIDVSDCAGSSSVTDIQQQQQQPSSTCKIDSRKAASFKTNRNQLNDDNDTQAATLPLPKITFTLAPPDETINTPLNNIPEKKEHRNTNINARVRRKTLIMFILTTVFIITTILYFTLLSFIARSDDILSQMSDEGRAAYFFFFRLYFINHVINPVLYGLLDPKFRKIMTSLRKTMSSTFLSSSISQTASSKLND